MQPTGGARAKARSAEPCEPASRGKEQCGAALRGHACDDISRVRSAIHCFQVLIDGPVQPAPQVSRR